MARSLRSHRRKKNRAIKLAEIYRPVDRERQERVNNRLLVNTYLNNPSGRVLFFAYHCKDWRL